MILDIAKKAKSASYELANLKGTSKNNVLSFMAKTLGQMKAEIIEANRI